VTDSVPAARPRAFSPVLASLCDGRSVGVYKVSRLAPRSVSDVATPLLITHQATNAESPNGAVRCASKIAAAGARERIERFAGLNLVSSDPNAREGPRCGRRQRLDAGRNGLTCNPPDSFSRVAQSTGLTVFEAACVDRVF
jgi:hypothetical protein